MIVTLGRSVFTHQARVVWGYALYGLHTGVRGHAMSMCPGSLISAQKVLF